MTARSVLLQWQTQVDWKWKHSFTFQYLFQKILPLVKQTGKIWKSQRGHRWQGKMPHAQCMPDTWGYRHTPRICDTYCLSTTKMVTRTRLNISFISTLAVLLHSLIVAKHDYNVLFTSVFTVAVPCQFCIEHDHSPTFAMTVGTPGSSNNEP